MHSTKMSSDKNRYMQLKSDGKSMNKEWEGKVGKEDRLFKEKLYEERNPCLFSRKAVGKQ